MMRFIRNLFVKKHPANSIKSNFLNNIKIDFMIQQSGSVVPVEVKAERNVHAKSLRAYYDKYHPEETIRLSMNDYRQEEWVENIPLFAMHAFF